MKLETRIKQEAKNHSSLSTSRYFDLEIPEGQMWFSPKEFARLMGVSPQHVRNCFDDKRIFGHDLSRAGLSKKSRYQVHRDALIFYLLSTANYEDSDFMELFTDALSKCSKDQLRSLREAIRSRLKVKSFLF